MSGEGRDLGVAFVSGAGSGIGQATSVGFVAEGRTVLGVDLNESGLADTERLCADGPGLFAGKVADVTDPGAVDAAVAEAVGLGRLGAAVNAAGIVGPTLKLGGGSDSSRLRDVADADWDRVIAINLSGVFNCVRAQMRAMWEEGGAIVNLASIAGLVGTAGLGPYVASKHGVVGLGKAAALEGAPRKIRVNTVCPGTVATPMLLEAFGDNPEQTTARDAATPLGRPAEPEELAATCVWLCGDGASYITGAAIPVDGGTTSMNPRSGVARR